MYATLRFVDVCQLFTCNIFVVLISFPLLLVEFTALNEVLGLNTFPSVVLLTHNSVTLTACYFLLSYFPMQDIPWIKVVGCLLNQ